MQDAHGRIKLCHSQPDRHHRIVEFGIRAALTGGMNCLSDSSDRPQSALESQSPSVPELDAWPIRSAESKSEAPHGFAQHLRLNVG